ncbi:hypothetical protein [Cylindrospermopsis sp. CR12]|nr:hypothetical protein [Cylindrospermopsis sp. CR12]
MRFYYQMMVQAIAVGNPAKIIWFVGFRASTQPTITHDKTSRV